MTRDEAIAKAANRWFRGGAPGSSSAKDHAKLFVEMAIDLGMLKLDEPKSAKELAMRALLYSEIGSNHGGMYHSYTLGDKEAAQIVQFLEDAGLKIVEK